MDEAELTRARLIMVDRQLRARGIRDPELLRAFDRVPRHRFVPDELVQDAYADRPLPIGEDQTISQPYIVGAMLEPLAISNRDVVLEIGTGSGYQTALLCELAREVYSIERHVTLAQHAERILQQLGYHNAHLAIGDGSAGLPEFAPYDAIVVSAAAPRVPESLVQQLAERGRMVAPVGTADAQELAFIRRSGNHVFTRYLDPCRFVPLIGREGFAAS